MGESKHTPGPWKRYSTHVYSPSGKANVASVGSPRAGDCVGYTELSLSDPDFDEAHANAELISRAPELLRELTEARARIAALEAGLRAIVEKAPTEDPGRYDGDNHGDSFSSGWENCEYAMAQIARAALAPKETK